MIISNREVFDYGHRDTTNGKNIINFMINKDRQRKAQTGKENINIIDTKEFNFYCYLDAYITMSEPSAIIPSILLEH